MATCTENDVVNAFDRGDKETALNLLSIVREKPSTIRGLGNWTLLHLASHHDWSDVCRLLVNEYQLDPHCVDSDGWTALHYACENNNYHVVRYLVQNCCADPLLRNNSGSTPLNLSRGDSRKFIEEIIDASKKQGFKNVTKYLMRQASIKAEAEATRKAVAILDEAMSEGSGELSQCNVLFHGPPGAGKSSVKCLILGQPPRPKHKQNATDIIERSVRTVCVSRVAATSSNKHFTEVDNDDLISRIAVEVEKHRKNTENKQRKSVKPQIASINIKEAAKTLLAHQSVDEDDDAAEDVDHAIANESTATEEFIKERLVQIQLSSSDAIVESIFDSCWLHHIDSGGQPQFLDVFPLLYNSPSHCVVVMRLTEGLDTRPRVRFYCKGNDKYCLPDHLVLSNCEMIIRTCQIAQSIAQATNGKFIPRVFIVGTHLDKVGFFKGSRLKCVQKIDQQLAPIYQQYSKVMVRKSADEYIFPVNTMATGRERQKYTEEFQKCILSATEKMNAPVTVPLKWMTFHLEIDKAEEGVIRMPSCLEVGKKLKMTEEKVRVALQFLNSAALILYYPDDVPNLVLTKMDPFTNRLSRLIKASFIPPDNEPAEECIELREKGVFKKSFLRRVFVDLDETLLSDEEFLKLLVRLKIAVNINGDFYFLPSALSLERPSEGSSFKCQSNPLALLWNGLILPHGFFLTMSVEMQDKSRRGQGYVFELRRDIAQWRGEIQLSESDKKIPGVVKLTDRQRWIQVSYSGDKSYCPAIYDVVASATEQAIERLKHTGIGSPTIGCVCPLCPENEEDHFCYLSEDRRFITCSVNESKTGPVTEDISCWLEGDSQSTNRIPKVFSSSDKVEEMSNPVPSSDVEQEKDNSPIGVFNRHTPEILGVVSDIDSLLANLISSDVISEDDVTCSLDDGVGRYQRVKTVMDAVQSCLVKSNNPNEILVKFCTVLSQHDNNALKRLSSEIKHELMINLSPSSDDALTNDVSSTSVHDSSVQNTENNSEKDTDELVYSHAPDPDEMFKLLKKKANQWNDIGRELKVSFTFRESLQKEGIMSSDADKLEKVLRKWEESKCSEVTWRQAIEVFRELEFNDVIESAQKFLGK